MATTPVTVRRSFALETQSMTIPILIAILVAVQPGEKKSEDDEQTPEEAVAAMHSLLADEEFEKFYELHCHKHMRDQLDKTMFLEAIKGEQGKAVIELFEKVHQAIEDEADDEVLIARPEEDKKQYEFILVQVKKKRAHKNEQWHLELQKEDGKWKLMDTD